MSHCSLTFYDSKNEINKFDDLCRFYFLVTFLSQVLGNMLKLVLKLVLNDISSDFSNLIVTSKPELSGNQPEVQNPTQSNQGKNSCLEPLKAGK